MTWDEILILLIMVMGLFAIDMLVANTVVTRGDDDPLAILKEKTEAWERRDRFNIIPAPKGLEGISSSAIRNKLRAGENGVKEMCHPKVWELLIKHRNM